MFETQFVFAFFLAPPMATSGTAPQMDSLAMIRSFLPIGIMFGIKYLDLENPNIILLLRGES